MASWEQSPTQRQGIIHNVKRWHHIIIYLELMRNVVA